jgi:hypothetical protein
VGATLGAQVIELPAGVASHNIWREVALMRQASASSHERIVPLLGVAIMVRWCQPGSMAQPTHCSFGSTCMPVLQQLPSRFGIPHGRLALLQGQVLMLAMKLMRGGSLRRAMLNAAQQQMLRWQCR